MFDKPLSPTAEVARVPAPEEPEIEIVLETDEDPLQAVQDALDSIADLTESFDANLAERFDESFLLSLSTELKQDYEDDKNSRKEWERSLEQGILLLGLQMEERNEPWEGASGVFHPMLTEAAIRFQSEMISEVFPALGPVKAKLIGFTNKEQEEAAKRVVEYMNHFLTDEAPEFRPEFERLLFSLALFGSAFKKIYYDAKLGRPTSVFVPAEDLIVPYGATDLETAPRITHVMRKTKNDLKRLQISGFYRDIGELNAPSANPVTDSLKNKIDKVTGISSVDDDRFTLLEMFVELDNEELEEGTAPYVVTMLENTGDILSIRRNWNPDDPDKKPLQHLTKYDYIPGFGFYSFGLIHLLGNSASAATSLTRQLIDAGTLSNLPGGLKTNGLRITGDDTPISPGEWRDVDIPSGALRDNLMPLPYKEPSQTLAALRDTVVEEARRLSSTADVRANDMNSEAPVGTTLAIIERTMKVMSAIQARCHTSMTREFKLIANLIKDYTAPEYNFSVSNTGSSGMMAKKADFEQTDIIPVSDPNSATVTQRILQGQAAIQLAQQAPGVMDMAMLCRQMLTAMNIKDADKIVPIEDDLRPTGPVDENMRVLKGDPVKAFLEQDHQAHLAVHNAFINDPMIGGQMAQNPKAQQIMASLQAHIAEHIGFQYRFDIEQQLGIQLPPPGEPVPEGMEQQMAPLLAEAAQQVQQLHAAQQAQQQAQQQQQDPLFQQQQMELQLKAQEIQSRHQVELLKLETQKQLAELDAKTKLDIQSLKDQATHATTAAEIIKERIDIIHAPAEPMPGQQPQGVTNGPVPNPPPVG